MDHAEEVLNVAFPPRDQASRVVQPGEAFDHPAPTRSPQRPAILRGGSDAVVFVGGDEIDGVLVEQRLIDADRCHTLCRRLTAAESPRGLDDPTVSDRDHRRDRAPFPDPRPRCDLRPGR